MIMRTLLILLLMGATATAQYKLDLYGTNTALTGVFTGTLVGNATTATLATTANSVVGGAVSSIGGVQGALTSLNVASSGSASAGQVRADAFIGDGSQLTGLPASGVSVAAGTNMVLTTNSGVVTIAGPQIMWGMTTTNTITNSLSKGTMLINIGGGVTATSFSGSGASLTTIPATSLTGTIDDARLSANVALLATAQTFTQSNQFVAGVSISGRTVTTNGITSSDSLAGNFPSISFPANDGAGVTYWTNTTCNTVWFNAGAGVGLGTAICRTNLFPSGVTRVAVAASTISMTVLPPGYYILLTNSTQPGFKSAIPIQ